MGDNKISYICYFYVRHRARDQFLYITEKVSLTMPAGMNSIMCLKSRSIKIYMHGFLHFRIMHVLHLLYLNYRIIQL